MKPDDDKEDFKEENVGLDFNCAGADKDAVVVGLLLSSLVSALFFSLYCARVLLVSVGAGKGMAPTECLFSFVA